MRASPSLTHPTVFPHFPLLPTPYSLLPTPYSLLPTPYSLRITNQRDTPSDKDQQFGQTQSQKHSLILSKLLSG
ncbi:MAG: hypothetical protein F6J90_24125 [Moorea sp. SIOASIH]|uniref:hypothetical protein n=1 Tax=Moorena sp. SIOASIH TaxID=2607817 RepID=UPI0013B8C2AA|nr:hypothetical protein [Moorena sp. SIOASIH]NEO39255.1 hypothetical protein [Moorena sp. SIOASIH]